MKLGEKQEIFTSNVAKLITYAEVVGFKGRLREVQRTKEQQDIYIKDGKSWTNNSKHLDSLACDIYFTKSNSLLLNKEDLQILGDYWQSLHQKNRWGGNYEKNIDTPHFELVD